MKPYHDRHTLPLTGTESMFLSFLLLIFNRSIVGPAHMFSFSCFCAEYILFTYIVVMLTLGTFTCHM
jgi:hypothetical protein